MNDVIYRRSLNPYTAPSPRRRYFRYILTINLAVTVRVYSVRQSLFDDFPHQNMAPRATLKRENTPRSALYNLYNIKQAFNIMYI